MGRLRKRLDRIENEANEVFDSVDDVLDLAELFMERAIKGFTIEFEVPEDFDFRDLFSGKTKKLPIQMKVKVGK